MTIVQHINELVRLWELHEEGSGGPVHKVEFGPGEVFWRQWFATGQLEMEGGFLNDVPHGAWRLYDESGRVTCERSYKDGVAISPDTPSAGEFGADIISV
jgi:hypothetical protein